MLLGVAVALPAAAQLYGWTDEQGVRHFTDSPPPATATDVVRRDARAAPAETDGEPFALKLAREKYPVTLFTSPTCGTGCDESRRHLNERGVPFREINVADQASYDELLKVSPDAAIPILRVGETVLRGYQGAAFDSALDVAGYPKTGILPPRAQTAPGAEAADAPEGEEAAAAQPGGPYAPPPGPSVTPGPGPYAPPEGAKPAPSPGPYAPPEGEKPSPSPGPYAPPPAPRRRAPAR